MLSKHSFHDMQFERTFGTHMDADQAGLGFTSMLKEGCWICNVLSEDLSQSEFEMQENSNFGLYVGYTSTGL